MWRNHLCLSADKPVDIDWAHAEQCLWSKMYLYTIDTCVDLAKTALSAGCMLGKLSCPVCKSVLMETSAEALGCHLCPHCSHKWSGPKVVANPLAALRPYLSLVGVLCFELQRPWEVASAANFARLSR